MVTDLKKIGQVKGSRRKGMQAMLYKYDQLHRIIQSRGLTTYSPSTGFAAPASGYNEDFAYDANGNIQTLQQRDAGGVLADNFTYSYYPHTNKLRYHILILRDTVYSGAIASTNKVYRRITVQGTAFAPSAKDVVIKAIENIDIDQGFTVQSGATFRAYVLTNEEGAYNYDAIGNLIWDQDKGVRISWTPYGKVREVTKGDGTVVSFRYDGAGNRIEKKMVKGQTTTITRYVRDAGGNVMAVYNGAVLLEQSIYGSTRLELYHDGAVDAQRTLGFKTYELSNHLGNVLSVLTDNIRMTPDSTWATVVSAGDYYAFGSGMPGRDFADGAYRYGFNGKERDQSAEFAGLHYDYGFRIYDSAIAKFLSVDPLQKSYPELTPYQFASNSPIVFVDIDGLEGGYDIRFQQMQKGYLKGTVTKDELTEFHKANAVGTIMGIGMILTRGAILRYYPYLLPGTVSIATNPIAQQTAIGFIVGIGGYDGVEFEGFGDDFGRIGRKGFQLLTKRGITKNEELGRLARQGYNDVIGTIDSEIAKLETLKEKAEKVFELRNKAKEFARELSGPENKAAAELDSFNRYGIILMGLLLMIYTRNRTRTVLIRGFRKPKHQMLLLITLLSLPKG